MATPTCAIGLVQPYMYEPSEPESGSEEEEDSGRPVHEPRSSQSSAEW